MLPFRNIEPRSREERASMKNKEAIEKLRLSERTGGFHQFEEGGVQPESSCVGSTHYLGEAERFDKDFAVYDKKVRENTHDKVMTLTQAKREHQLKRQEEQWATMEAREKKEEERIHHLKQGAYAGNKNKASVPFNPFTLEYDKSPEGHNLYQRDLEVEHRALQRSHLLDTKGNGQFDILTGETRKIVNVPDKPSAVRLGRAPFATDSY